MKFLKKIHFAAVLKYAAVLAAFAVFGNLWRGELPLSSALLTAFLYMDFSIIATPALYIIACLITGKLALLPSAAIGCVITAAIFAIYRAAKAKPKAEVIIYSLVALIPYFIMADGGLYEKIAVGVLNTLICAAAIPALRCIIFKGLKYKPDFEEILSLALLAVCFGTGVSNLAGVGVWKCISVFLILAATYIYRLGVSVTLAALLGISASVYHSDLSYVGLFTVWAVCSLSVMKTSRYLAAVAVPLADFALMRLFNIDPSYGIPGVLYTIGGALAFCVLPTKFLAELKEKLYTFRERQLVRQTVNRNRYILSNKLYELSGVFLEIGNVLTSLKRETVNENAAKKHLADEICTSVCAECENRPKCRAKKIPSEIALEKLLNIGLAKGKISFIDMPQDISSHCIHTNNMIFCVNKLLAEYRNYMIESINYDKSKQLIAGQATGIAEVLKGLAFETGQTLKYRNNLERKLSDKLKKAGVSVNEILIYGDGDDVTVSMIISGAETPVSRINAVVSSVIELDMRISERALVQEDKIFILLKKESRFDAVFGVASLSKDGSEKCGDTHSVQRLECDKFLIALSDGMGSGKYAESISDASLSLIESFYKAGMSSPLIMSTVNKLLAINTEDSFAALDICVFDLNNLSADFIKFGAPYGFVITEDGIKIVEGSSLPLGILDDLKPSVTNDSLVPGDMLLFVTDGVSDAFGSSSSLIDYLQKQPAKNPQTLAESVISEAVNLSGGRRPDDMTCLAVRVFERKTA